jgi:hypothetical protein
MATTGRNTLEGCYITSHEGRAVSGEPRPLSGDTQGVAPCDTLASDSHTGERTMRKPRSTYDICGDCYSDTIPDQYFPEATRFGTCNVCWEDAFIVRTPKTIVRTGSTVMYVNRHGEPEYGVVIEMASPGDVVVSFPDGRYVRTVCESIGVGVDDTILGIFDNGEVI